MLYEGILVWFVLYRSCGFRVSGGEGGGELELYVCKVWKNSWKA